MDNINSCNQDQSAAYKHSGLGITSFIISISVVVYYFGYAILTVILSKRFVPNPNYSGYINMSSVGKYMSLIAMNVLGAITGNVFNLVGIGFGIAGVIQKDRKKVFVMLGLIFNSITFLVTAILIVVSISVMLNVF